MAANVRANKFSFQLVSLMSRKTVATNLGVALATYLEEHYFKGD